SVDYGMVASGERRDEGADDRPLGLDQCLEFPDDLTAAGLDRADLGDLGLARPRARRLEVDDDERDLRQGSAEAVERQLRVVQAAGCAIEWGGHALKSVSR